MKKICELVPNELVCLIKDGQPKSFMWVKSVSCLGAKAYVQLGRESELEIPGQRVFNRDELVLELHELDNTTKYLCLVDDYSSAPPVEVPLTKLEILWCESLLMGLKVSH